MTMKNIDSPEKYARKSREYANYIDGVIEEFNSDGKPTVVMAIDAFYPVVDGVVTVVDNYSSLIKDFNVLVVAPSFKGEVYARDYPVLGVKAAYSKALAYQIPAVDRRAKKALKKLKIDLIHCHSPFFVGRYLKKVAKKRNIPFISTFHSQYKKDFIKSVGKGPLLKFMMGFIMKTFRFSREVWTMNEACVDIIRDYGYGGKTRIIPHGTFMLPPENYAAEREAARKRIGAGDEILFLFVGRIVTQKEILFIADVLGILKKRGLDFKMLFVGKGPDKGKLVAAVEKNDVADRVIYEEKMLSRGELASVYSAADMLMFPSTYDTFALVKVEAASRFTPTAFSEGSAASGGIENGVDGYVFPLEAEKFADGVLAAVSDRKKLAEVGENARERLYATWDGIIGKVEDAYREIIAESKKQ